MQLDVQEFNLQVGGGAPHPCSCLCWIVPVLRYGARSLTGQKSSPVLDAPSAAAPRVAWCGRTVFELPTHTLTPFEPHKSSSVGDSPAHLHTIAINKKQLREALAGKGPNLR